VKQPWANLRLLSYVVPVGAALLSVAAGDLFDLTTGERYTLAFAMLTAIAAMLIRQEVLLLAVASQPAEQRKSQPVPRPAAREFWVTRMRLGLEHLQARSGGIEAEAPILWLPTSDRTRRIWLQAYGADLVVGARAEVPGPQVARVSFALHQPVYVLLRQEEAPGEASGYATVPNLAAYFADQEIGAGWFGLRDLPEEEAEAIGFSVAWANHATRLAWRESVNELPPDHPVRIAVSSRA
jgi:hypothetical protein